MNLKGLLTHLLRKDTPDEEARVDTGKRSRPSGNTGVSEKVANGHAATRPTNGPTEVADNLGNDDDQEYDGTLPITDAKPRGLGSIFSRIWSSIFPSPNEEEEIQAYIPHYRILPIVSGITIPFCILLEIPGITQYWSIRTNGSSIVASKPNPVLLDVGMSLSLLCAVLANVCLVIRFLERRIKTMTIMCAVFLSIHDSINVAALATLGSGRDGYTFGQAFWMTLCSTIVSAFTNVTLIVDLVRTPDFRRSGSGLTRRQRSLVIIIIGLFCYIALGALVNSLLLDLTFINGLYFTVVTIETIGFGDIVPSTKGSRIFICFYATIGIINLAFVVSYVRETVLEGLDFGYRRRLQAIQERRRAAILRKRAERRWRRAIVWRLRERRARVWIPKDTGDSLWSKIKNTAWHAEGVILSTAQRGTQRSPRRPGTQLNLWALPRCQLEAAALEAGVPLDTLLPPSFYDTYDQDICDHAAGAEHHTYPSWFAVNQVYHQCEDANRPLTYRRLGIMSAMLTKLGFSIYESGGSPLPTEHDMDEDTAQDSSGTLQVSSTVGDYPTDVDHTEKKAYLTRSSLSWCWLLIFWMGGALIFRATEGWTYGMSIYFCFIAFSTIGYGDLSPTTPAGRSIFVVWALVGVATITIFVSVVSEAYTSRYKGILGRNSFRHVVKRYHTRTNVELSEKVQRIGTRIGSSGIKLTLHDTMESQVTDATDGRGESPPASAVSAADETPVASTSRTDAHVLRTQRSLEQLPKQILTETRSIQQYMQLMGGLDVHSVDTEKYVDETLWSLVDDVMGGRKLTEYTKADILKDGECRQTLMMLGIERSLKELVNISEQAISAIRERDRIIADLEREKEQDEDEGVQSR